MDKLKKVRKNNSCVAAILINNNRVLLGNRVYPEKNLSLWNFPGGRCEENETLEQALKREVLEEIGIANKDFKILDFIGEIKGSWEDDVLYLFYCSTNAEPILMEPEKFKEWRWFDLEKVLKTHFNDDAINFVKDYLQNKRIS